MLAKSKPSKYIMDLPCIEPKSMVVCHIKQFQSKSYMQAIVEEEEIKENENSSSITYPQNALTKLKPTRSNKKEFLYVSLMDVDKF